MRVLFLDTVHPCLHERLAANGFLCEAGWEWPRQAVLGRVGGYQGIVIRSRTPIDRELLDAAVSLRFIARAGAGMENIDAAYAQGKGILCINAPEGNRDAVGEHAIGMLLTLFNRIHTADREVRSGLWQREANRGVELLGSTVGIIGYGNTGRAFAKRLSGFGVLTYAYDKYKQDYTDEYVIETGLGPIFEEADVVSLHVPLTPETHHLVNDEFFQRLHNPIYLINTSRGPVADTGALLRALDSGMLLGACLDVLEDERPSFEKREGAASEAVQRLMASDRVLLTPHVAGWSHQSHVRISEVLAEKILAAFAAH